MSGRFDAVLFSYSLTMIPDWFAAIENALLDVKGKALGLVLEVANLGTGAARKTQAGLPVAASNAMARPRPLPRRQA